MSKIREYVKILESNNIPFEEQQKALREIENVIKESKAKREQGIDRNTEFVINAFKQIETKLNKKYDELLKTPAMVGERGPKGENGKDGKNGKDGRDGRDGKDGKDGKDGVDGKDGISVVDASIDFDGSLVIKLSDGNIIDAGQIISESSAKEYNAFMTRGEIIPTQSGNSGKFLTTDGNTLSWATVSGGGGASLPDQTGNNGKYLKTDGSNASWDQIDISTSDVTGTLPVTSGGTGATSATNARINLLPTYTGNAGKVLAVNVGETDTEWITPSSGGVSLAEVRKVASLRI